MPIAPIVEKTATTPKEIAYRLKSVTPSFSKKLNGEHPPEIKSTRVERDQKKVRSILDGQEDAQGTIDTMRRLGFNMLAGMQAAQAGIVDWAACVAAVTEEDIQAWATWRGRTEESIALFVERGVYGKYAGSFALPLHDPRSGKLVGVKTRPDLNDKGWKIHPLGSPNLPLIIGDPKNAEMLLVAESPFDLHRVIDELELFQNSNPWCGICTQGSGNAKAIDDVFRRDVQVIAIMQNDDPARQWYSDLSGHLMRPIYLLKTPWDVNIDRPKDKPQVNDIDDWFRYGGVRTTRNSWSR